jgi:hypothetical protein
MWPKYGVERREGLNVCGGLRIIGELPIAGRAGQAARASRPIGRRNASRGMANSGKNCRFVSRRAARNG